ncbi:Glycogen-binding subunit 76A [Schistosoma japonicum]|uniref:Glycogen-binding subunit 76A n=2 Tax=Schistosoma japonicum TaxID=6182 RepID=A0A4Z2DUV5_SCHJA|nr:Glycogen-binding subunit 76A [Schistosoma japonicum]
MSDTSHLNSERRTPIDFGGSASADINTETNTTTNQRPHVSTWVYIKWFIWSTIASIFGCSIPVFTTPYDNTWPTTSILADHNKYESDNLNTVENNDDAYSSSSIQLNEVNSTYTTKNSITQFSSNYTIESDLITETKISHSFQNHIHENELKLDSFNDINGNISSSSPSSSLINGYLCDFNQTLNCKTITETELLSFSTTLFTDSEYLHKNSDPVTFTLLDVCHSDSVKGIIDKVTYDNQIHDLINSVLPRNLSNSSDISVEARKMYAWNKPTAIEPQTSINECNLEEGSLLSGDASASPGQYNLSDHSYPPLSPSTLGEDSLQAGCFDKSPTIDLNLPDISRSDQTLAWAMSNLGINNSSIEIYTDTNESIHNKQIEDLSPTDETIDFIENVDNKCSISSRPPVPNSLHRPSRDRSPAHCTSMQSNRTKNSTDLSTFLPFDGDQLFSVNDKAETPETVKPKRSSSLKSNRSLSDAHVQKAVRFADALGLDLATERRVFDSEAPPKIPASATLDLRLDSDESIARIGAKQFGLCFSQPGLASNFVRRVLASNVCLEDCHIDMQHSILTGTIRVKSMGYEKRVTIRITYNNWITFFDTSASYVQGSYDGVTDKFSFSLVFPDTMAPGDKAQFAIRYETHTGEQFWDNNHGQNYCVTCYAKATDLAGDGSWMHYL